MSFLSFVSLILLWIGTVPSVRAFHLAQLVHLHLFVTLLYTRLARLVLNTDQLVLKMIQG